MTKLYLIRHCETVANREHVFQGSLDRPVSDIGQKQLDRLTARFENTHIDGIFSSPYGRAYKTAEAVRGKRDMEIVCIDEVREINGGVYEGTPFVEKLKADPVLYDIWNNKPHLFEPQKGERASEVYSRVKAGIQKIVAMAEGKTVAVTTHGFALRCILAYLMFDDITRLADAPIPFNTAVTTVEFYSDGSHKITVAGDTSHLPDELKTSFKSK